MSNKQNEDGRQVIEIKLQLAVLEGLPIAETFDGGLAALEKLRAGQELDETDKGEINSVCHLLFTLQKRVQLIALKKDSAKLETAIERTRGETKPTKQDQTNTLNRLLVDALKIYADCKNWVDVARTEIMTGEVDGDGLDVEVPVELILSNSVVFEHADSIGKSGWLAAQIALNTAAELTAKTK